MKVPESQTEVGFIPPLMNVNSKYELVFGSQLDGPNGFVKVNIFYATVHYAKGFILKVEVRVHEATLFRMIADEKVILICYQLGIKCYGYILILNLVALQTS